MPYKNIEERRRYQQKYYQSSRKFARRRHKQRLVNVLGGKCSECGYNKYLEALEFHHLNPVEKEFTIANTFRSFEKDLMEIKKCKLLCANCHAEEHANMAS